MWKIHNKKTKKNTTMKDFAELKIKCEAIVLEGIEKDFQILYYEDGELEDVANINDYF